ncbi:MAG TPA: hypothetical protein VMC61_00115 [Methanocella sp.]|nr:hypothetical protein [Methanocella sp.]
MDRDIYPMSKMAEDNRGRMAAGEADSGGYNEDLIQSIEGVIDAVSKEEDHFRFVGKTNGGVDISVDVEPGEMLTNVGGLVIRARGGHAEVDEGRFAVYNRREGIYAEFDIEPGSRFKLKFGFKR